MLLVGELAQVVERMLPGSTLGLHGQLVQTPQGKAVTYAVLRNRFDAARIANLRSNGTGTVQNHR